MTASLAAALLLQAPAIALTPHAMTLDAAMRELATKTGEPYRASARMGSRIVLSCGPARPVATVRDDLAAATWGVWRHGPSGWTLDEDTDGVHERDGARAARRRESVERAFKALSQGIGGPFDAAAARALQNGLRNSDPKPDDKENDSFTRVQALAKSMPSMNALKRIVLSFGAKDLADLPDGRLVFSDRPTRLQRQLPSAAGSALAGLVRDQNVWAGVYKQEDLTGRSGGTLTMDPRNYADPISPDNLRLILETNVSRGDIRFQAWFVDKNLSLVQFAETDLDVTSAPQLSAAPAVDPNDKPLTLGGETDAYAAALAGKASPAMRAKLMDPVKYEPLDFYAGEVVRAIARDRKKAATIWLDDNLVAFAFDTFHRASKTRPNTASEWIKQLWIRAFNSTERPDAIVFRPRGNCTNVDRRRMADLLRVADTNGYVPLDDLADFAVAAPPDEWNGMPMLDSMTLKAILPLSDGAQSADWRMLRLWGMFSREMRRQFRAGAKISLAALREDQRQAFISEILQAQRYEIQKANPGEGSDGTMGDEPTELLANGFRTDGSLTATFDAKLGVMARSAANDPEEVWPVGTTDAWGLANATYERERKPGDKHYDGLPQTLPNAFVPGSILNFGFTILLTPKLSWSKTGQYGEFNSRANAVPLADFPEFKKAYDEALGGMRSAQPGSIPLVGAP